MGELYVDINSCMLERHVVRVVDFENQGYCDTCKRARRRRLCRRVMTGRTPLSLWGHEKWLIRLRKKVISWSSAGTCGFKGTRKGTPFAAQTAAGNAIRVVIDQGRQRAEIMIKCPGLGRDATLRTIRRSGILLSFIRDVTFMLHNGCRPHKKRCI
ncbi:hypothetical protein Gohar_012133 [Gossypium harknessii]|uniref:Ribosomal protein S11 n=1 Tax=Gossypium harknessii TaxID=34285 RepID=A0A7J9GW24_9ROSI|nr:hypothetical protein [Gossypium harknessii]